MNLRGHHKHSLYLLQAAEIFGLSRDDMQLVGNIARYHRRGLRLYDENTREVTLPAGPLEPWPGVLATARMTRGRSTR